MIFWAGSSLCKVNSNAGVHGALLLSAGKIKSHIPAEAPREKKAASYSQGQAFHMVLCAGPPLVRVGVHSYAPPDSSFGSVWGRGLFTLAYMDSYVSTSSLGTWL